MAIGSPRILAQFSKASVGTVPKITSRNLPSTDFPISGQICLLTVVLSLDAISVLTDVIKVQRVI